MNKIFNPRKVNSYSADELFEFSESGVVTTEELAKIGLEETALLELDKRIKEFREIKEKDDWNSVKKSGKDKIEQFIDKYQFDGKFIDEANSRLYNLRELERLEPKIEDIKKTELQRLLYSFEEFQKIEQELRNLLSHSSSPEREQIERKLKKIVQILWLLKEIIWIIKPRNEQKCYKVVQHYESEEYCCKPMPQQSCTGASQQSYIPQRLLDSFKWNFFKKKKSLCNSAIFAPSRIAKGDDMFVQVYIYKDKETDKVVIDSRMSDKDAIQRSYTPLNFPIKAGDIISVRLDMHDLSIEGDATKSVVWQNKYTKCSFFVYVPINYDKTKLKGDVYLSVNGLELGQMSFFSTIDRTTDLLHSAQVEVKIYEKVFISYSHKDGAIVRSIAEAYKALGTIDYFYDRHTLSPGELFEKKIYEYIDLCDLFILCWSKNAEKSEWVKKERVRAFYRAIDSPPRLEIYPINIPPYAPPPSDMARTIHFEDYDKLIDLPES